MKRQIIAATLTVAVFITSCSPGSAEQKELCKDYKIYHNEKTDCFIYKLRERDAAYFIYRNNGNYYIYAEANLYRTQLMYSGPAYPTQEAALQVAITMNRLIPLNDDLSLSNGYGREGSFKNNVETICD